MSSAPNSYIQLVKQETPDTFEIVAERKVYTWKNFQEELRNLREMMNRMDSNRLSVQFTESGVMQ